MIEAVIRACDHVPSQLGDADRRPRCSSSVLLSSNTPTHEYMYECLLRSEAALDATCNLSLSLSSQASPDEKGSVFRATLPSFHFSLTPAAAARTHLSHSCLFLPASAKLCSIFRYLSLSLARSALLQPRFAGATASSSAATAAINMHYNKVISRQLISSRSPSLLALVCMCMGNIRTRLLQHNREEGEEVEEEAEGESE